jgi:hypothetical protein
MSAITIGYNVTIGPVGSGKDPEEGMVRCERCRIWWPITETHIPVDFYKIFYACPSVVYLCGQCVRADNLNVRDPVKSIIPILKIYS